MINITNVLLFAVQDRIFLPQWQKNTLRAHPSKRSQLNGIILKVLLKSYNNRLFFYKYNKCLLKTQTQQQEQVLLLMGTFRSQKNSESKIKRVLEKKKQKT